MFDLLRGTDPVAALPGAFAMGSQWFAADPYFAEPDVPDLPILTVVVALYEPRRITVAWVGNDKAYLLRDGRVVAESVEHTRRMLLRGPLARPLTPTEATPREYDIAWRAMPAEQRLLGPIRRLFANQSTLALSRDVRGPPAVMHIERRPGDALLLLGGSLHERLGWKPASPPPRRGSTDDRPPMPVSSRGDSAMAPSSALHLLLAALLGLTGGCVHREVVRDRAGEVVPRPRNLRQAILALDRVLDEETRAELRAGSDTHEAGVGFWIRNHWGLWSGSALQYSRHWR